MSCVETRKGKQTPTVSVVLSYTESLGAEAVELYNRSGRTAQDWQALMIEDIMAINEDGLWPRRAGSRSKARRAWSPGAATWRSTRSRS